MLPELGMPSSSQLMAVAEIVLKIGSTFKFGVHEGFSLRGIPSGMDTIPVDNERDSMLPVMLHHQECECLGPGNKFTVYFKG
jgi:hypothetical protein